jgi:hypothetical protein
LLDKICSKLLKDRNVPEEAELEPNKLRKSEKCRV